MPKKIGSLEIEPEAKAPSKLFCQVQIIVYLTFFIIVMSGVLGLFGNGLFSQTVRANANTQIKYNFTGRLQSQDELEIQIKNYPQPLVPILISNAYLNAVTIKQITPTSLQQVANSNAVIFYFLNNNKKTTFIRFYYEPKTAGLVNGEIGLMDKPRLIIKQFFYP